MPLRHDKPGRSISVRRNPYFFLFFSPPDGDEKEVTERKNNRDIGQARPRRDVVAFRRARGAGGEGALENLPSVV